MLVFWIIAGLAAFWAAALWFLRRVWFYRDPVRIPPEDPEQVVAPADGQVVYIRRFENGRVFAEKLGRSISIQEIVREPELASQSGWLIGIYMSPLDVHFNYAPVDGAVTSVVHTPAAVNWPMVDLWEYVRLTYLRRVVDLFGKQYHLENERNTIVVSGRHGKVAVVEIADKFVNKISCYVKPGDQVQRGQKLSFIARGSQADLVFFRDDVEFLVEVGQQVYGGQTAVARLAPQPAAERRTNGERDLSGE